LDDAVSVYMGTDESRWCGNYNYAHCYLTAHLLKVGNSTKLGDSSSKSGTITNRSAGNVSTAYSVNTHSGVTSENWYNSTSYGQTFIIIRDNCLTGVLVANDLFGALNGKINTV
jgi:hypothetical protein